MARVSVPDASWTPSWAGVPGRVPPGRDPRTHWRDYVTRLAWEHLGIPTEEQEVVSREREVWTSLFRLLDKWKKIDGWIT